jgi:hypothetical protein
LGHFQLHAEATYHPLSLRDSCPRGVLSLVPPEHPWGLVQEFPFPPSQSLGFELVLSAGLCQALHPADQLENDARVNPPV